MSRDLTKGNITTGLLAFAGPMIIGNMLQQIYNIADTYILIGILMIQGLVNSFGTTVMAAFTIAVKIDALAYMPAQEFINRECR